MTRKEFQIVADKRLAEARALFRGKHYEGTYHLAGLSVECAIKACIARQTRRHEFPDKHRAQRAFDHNLIELIRVAALQPSLDTALENRISFAENWNIVKGWRIESRYTVIIKRSEADAILSAVADEQEGVMSWLQLHW